MDPRNKYVEDQQGYQIYSSSGMGSIFPSTFLIFFNIKVQDNMLFNQIDANYNKEFCVF